MTYDSTFGRCAQNGYEPGQPCEPSGRVDMVTPCTTGTFCKDLTECEEWPTPSGWITPGAGATCYLPAREGERCDGDWDSATACAPCEPGTKCTTTSEDSVNRCRRPCENAETDCSCAAVELEAECVDDAWCDYCVATYTQCESGGPGCCDGSATCETVRGLDMCCRADSTACTGDGQCCPGLECFEGECVGCIDFGELYNSMHPIGCCPGLTARTPEAGGADRCLVPCPEEKCYCGAGEEYDPTCTDRGNHCDPNDGYGGPDTNCNGKDDDCDGRVDEAYPDAGDACSNGVVPDGHCSGQTFPGRMECQDGTAVCVATEFCGFHWEATRNETAGDCNHFTGALCNGHSDCSPAQYCSSNGMGQNVCHDCTGVGEICWPRGVAGDGSCSYP